MAIEPDDFGSEQELLRYSKRLEGVRFSEINSLISDLDHQHRKHMKAVAAGIIETDYFGITKNSAQAPDFKKLKIELKVSPLKMVSSASLLTAKERNVIGMVDYHDVYNNASWHDNKRLSCKLGRVLFVFYLHDNTKPADEWRILTTFLWSPNGQEDAQIQEDYSIIRQKILDGLRNREGDNQFLATCPKHAGGFNKKNPSSSKPGSICPHPTIKYAERRGFCIRNAPVTRMVAKYGLGCDVVQKGRTIGIPRDKFKSIHTTEE